MRTFAEKQKSAQQTRSAGFTAPGKASCFHSNLGIQPLRRSMSENARSREVGSSLTTIGPLAHDFSRIPVYADTPAELRSRFTLSTPGDASEQEADRVAIQVMGMRDSQMPGTCVRGGGLPGSQAIQPAHAHGRLQIDRVQASDSGGTVAPQVVQQALNSGNQPLEAGTLTHMERRFGHNFEHVRVHSAIPAQQSARML